MPGIDETKTYYRVRVAPPGDFKRGSFRTITLTESPPHVRAVIGRPKGQTTTRIQSYLFPKSYWTRRGVQQWLSGASRKSAARRTALSRTRRNAPAGLHISGAYRRDPWGYAGMPVRIYPASEGRRLFAMRSARGVIATATDIETLHEYADQQGWIPTYGNPAWEIYYRKRAATLWRGKDAEGRTVWAVTDNQSDGTPVEPKQAQFHSFERARFYFNAALMGAQVEEYKKSTRQNPSKPYEPISKNAPLLVVNPRSKRQSIARLMQQLPPKLAKYAHLPGFEAALKKYVEFHGCLPTKVTFHKVAIGDPDDVQVMAAIGRAPAEIYEPTSSMKNSNKAGSAWIHEYERGKPMKAVTGDGKTIITLPAKYKVADWIRG